MVFGFGVSIRWVGLLWILLVRGCGWLLRQLSLAIEWMGHNMTRAGLRTSGEVRSWPRRGTGCCGFGIMRF